MAANSLLRRAIKKSLAPLLNEGVYRYLQGAAVAMDIRRGKWREPELDLIPFAVRPGDTVLDLGANYGFYTYHLSRAAGPSGRVHAFEPVPFTYRTLTLVARLLGLKNATCVAKGCSDTAGTIEVTLPIQKSGAPSAGQAHIGTRNDAREGSETQVRWDRTTRVTCEVVAIDDYLPSIDRVSLIKCDIEGAELLAFRGAARTIDAHHPTVICEINPWFLDGFGLRLDDLVGFFTSRGYGIYRYTSDKKLLPVASLDDIVEDNYVFIHPDRRAPLASLFGTH
ncbi:MAG: FkbM family methyltransferase [Acidobacteriota bacterium]